jgi:hypothetical protein
MVVIHPANKDAAFEIDVTSANIAVGRTVRMAVRFVIGRNTQSLLKRNKTYEKVKHSHLEHPQQAAAQEGSE